MQRRISLMKKNVLQYSKRGKFILTIDQGTTSTRLLLVDKNLHIVDVEQTEQEQINKQRGWCEHNPQEIWGNIQKMLVNLLQRNTQNKIECVGITNQRETVLALDRNTGKELTNAIVWHDQRTQNIVQDILKQKDQDYFRKISGLPLNTYFSLSKIQWLIQNELNNNRLQDIGFATMDSWLIYKLTNGKNFVTDSSNASRTMLMDINQVDYSQDMIKEFGLAQENLPQIQKSSNGLFGKIDFSKSEHEILQKLNGVPITGVLGDQQASCLGHILQEGQVKNTYGTGCFILANVGPKVVYSKHGLLSTICYVIDNKVQYALEGSVEAAGSGLQWLKKLGLISSYSELNFDYNKEMNDSQEIFFVPAFGGLYAPYWDYQAQGLLVGFSQQTDSHQILKAAIHSPCFRTNEVIESMVQDYGNQEIKAMMVDGGMSINDYMMQFQADISQMEIIRKEQKEITGIGASIAAGLQTQVLKSLDECSNLLKIQKRFQPKIGSQDQQKKKELWQRAIKKSLLKV